MRKAIFSLMTILMLGSVAALMAQSNGRTPDKDHDNAQAETDVISGVWNCVEHTGRRAPTFKLTLELHGTTVTGFEEWGSEKREITNGSFKNNKLTYTTSLGDAIFVSIGIVDHGRVKDGVINDENGERRRTLWWTAVKKK